jgi:hypothetical protein
MALAVDVEEPDDTIIAILLFPIWLERNQRDSLRPLEQPRAA